MSYNKRKPLLIGLDVVIVGVAVCASYGLHSMEGTFPSMFKQWMIYMLAASVIHTATMQAFKLYNRIWQYASIGELLSIVKAVAVAATLSYAAVSLLSQSLVPSSLGLRIFEMTLLLTGGSRFAWRVFRDSLLRKRTSQRRALIIGAGDCGMLIAREMKSDPSASMQPIAFIDDDPQKHHLQVLGLPVYGSRSRIPEAVDKLDIDDIVIALPSASRKEIAQIIDACKLTKAKLKMIPKISDLIRGSVVVKEMRDVELEDLLGREPFRTDLRSIAGYVESKTLLVTGAGGSIGSELCRQIAGFKPGKLLLLGHGENSIYAIEAEMRNKFPELHIETLIADVQDRSRMESVFATFKPHVVFHAAAHKHVPLMEKNPTEAVKNNVFGTRNVADCAHRFGAERFVLISTDKAVNPTSVMGATKRIAEMYIQSLNPLSDTIFAAVRFGNVLGSRGSVIPRFKEQIAAGGPVTVTHPHMIRYFMTIPEAVQLVVQAGSFAKGGEVFVLDMGEPVRILDLANDLIRLSGFEPGVDIDIAYTGMRPGEKMYEELLTDEEGLTSTKHNRIFIGKPACPPRSPLELQLNKLESSLGMDPEHVRRALGMIVPTYHREEDAPFPADLPAASADVGKPLVPLLV